MSKFSLLLMFSSLFFFCLPFAVSKCSRNPVIFNFGDSNSDTGGFSAATGYIYGYPDGRAYFHQPTGRLCDGRLVIDFLCENLNTTYLTPYHESVEPDFTNGVNFAFSGAATRPNTTRFNLRLQVLEFQRFRNRSTEFASKGFKNLVSEEDFRNALYIIDIGQNDLYGYFRSSSYDRVIVSIPSFISEIRDAILRIHRVGGTKFWVHNTGPLGCLPTELSRQKANSSELDRYGCIKSLNEGAKMFNSQLSALCQQLSSEMNDSTIVYVDMYTIKHDLIANSSTYGFKNPLMACCGYGGPPYNFDPKIQCRAEGYSVCEEGSPYISWDGVHYTEAANSIIAAKILSKNYSAPSIDFDFFCNNN